MKSDDAQRVEIDTVVVQVPASESEQAKPPENKPADTSAEQPPERLPEPKQEPSIREPEEEIPPAMKDAPGFLVVEQSPKDTGDAIKVSVDKRVRGRTPIRIELAPGRHDVVFSRDGKRKYKKAIIVSGEETELTATVPE